MCAVKLQIMQTENCPNGQERDRERKCNWEENYVESRNHQLLKLIRFSFTSTDVKNQFKVSLSFLWQKTRISRFSRSFVFASLTIEFLKWQTQLQVA